MSDLLITICPDCEHRWVGPSVTCPRCVEKSKSDKAMSDVITELRKANQCLYLEVVPSIADEVTARSEAVIAELTEALKWKNEDPRMLREQIRVADLAYNELQQQLTHERQLRLAGEVVMKVKDEALKKAQHRHRLQFAINTSELNTLKTPYDQALVTPTHQHAGERG